MSTAVCINCGNLKEEPVELCPVCNFKPEISADIIKSILLSTQDVGDLMEGKSVAELRAIAPLVAAGVYRFDEDEVRYLSRESEISLATPVSALLFDMFKWALPALIAIALGLWFARS
jgi:hypothetical protein